MKKLLLTATLLAAISATAMGSLSANLDTAVTDTLTVSANYVKLMTVTLDVDSIDFGASLVGFTAGSKVLNFTVDLDHANLDADVDIASTVTVSVTYDSIVDTPVVLPGV